MAKRPKTSNSKTNRKTLLTIELIGQIASEIEKGMYVNMACAMYGISRETWYDWLKKAKREPEIYPLCVIFSDTIGKCMAKHQQYHLGKIHDASVIDWKASAWVLERRYPKEFGKREALDITGVDSDIDNLKVKTEQDLIDEIKETDSALKELENDGQPRKK